MKKGRNKWLAGVLGLGLCTGGWVLTGMPVVQAAASETTVTTAAGSTAATAETDAKTVTLETVETEPAGGGKSFNPEGKALMDTALKAYQAKDYATALQLFKQADQKGHMKAARYLGLMYENGYGVPKDIREAVRWYQRAADLGDVTGTYYLGLCYEEGKGVKQDFAKAKALYETAAVRSDHVGAPGKLGLGSLYEKGEGVPKDLHRARYWYELAKVAGDPEADAALARAEKKLGLTEKPVKGTRVLTRRVSAGQPGDIVKGVTRIDSSKIWKPVEIIDFSPLHQVKLQNPDGTLSSLDMPWFQATEIAPGTWQIRNDGDYCYLLAGDELAVMVDSGYGSGNIRAFAQTLTDKPVKYVINTHYHFDHTANDAYFDAAFMTAESVPYATVPYASFAGLTFPRDYPIVTVQDGYKLNLGNRELTILQFPHSNHTLGGIAILDPSRKILFCGDEFLFPNRMVLNVSLQDFAANMERIQKVRDQFDVMYAGTGKKDGSLFDAYRKAAAYGVSPEFDPVRGELATATGGKPKTAATSNGRTVYVRGSVRPGDQTVDAPEKIPQGERRQYTVDGFTVTYIVSPK